MTEMYWLKHNLPREAMDVEQRFVLEMGKLLIKDVEDKTSEVVMVCVGRVRLSGGVRHFMLSVTKDDEGDSYWDARSL